MAAAGEKRRRLASKMKLELVGFDELPPFLKDNEFIRRHYRSEWPMKETILSLFSLHNETLNVWTHLLGFLLFLGLTVLTAATVPQGSSTSTGMAAMAVWDGCLFRAAAAVCSDGDNGGCNAVAALLQQSNSSSVCVQPAVLLDIGTSQAVEMKPVTRWPMFAFLVGAMACLLASSWCHLVCCHSESTASIALRVDYAGIAALIATSFYPLVYYTFLCEPFFRWLYIGAITAFGAATVAISFIPAFQKPEFRNVRAALFSCMGASGVVPVAHKLAVYGGQPEAVVSACWEALMGALYGAGAAVYAARVPERWMPGRFDVVGHSHQLFHLLVIAGAFTHYLGALVYLRWRDSQQC